MMFVAKGDFTFVHIIPNGVAGCWNNGLRRFSHCGVQSLWSTVDYRVVRASRLGFFMFWLCHMACGY